MNKEEKRIRSILQLTFDKLDEALAQPDRGKERPATGDRREQKGRERPAAKGARNGADAR